MIQTMIYQLVFKMKQKKEIPLINKTLKPIMFNNNSRDNFIKNFVKIKMLRQAMLLYYTMQIIQKKMLNNVKKKNL